MEHSTMRTLKVPQQRKVSSGSGSLLRSGSMRNSSTRASSMRPSSMFNPSSMFETMSRYSILMFELFGTRKTLDFLMTIKSFHYFKLHA